MVHQTIQRLGSKDEVRDIFEDLKVTLILGFYSTFITLIYYLTLYLINLNITSSFCLILIIKREISLTDWFGSFLIKLQNEVSYRIIFYKN